MPGLSDWRSGWFYVGFGALVWLGAPVLSGTWSSCPGEAGCFGQEVSNRFLPPPRVLLQRLARGKQAIQEGAWNVAVDELGAVLAPDQRQDDEGDVDQDYFMQSTDGSGAMPSLRREAQRLIGELPPAGRQLYELRYGAAARQLLQEALQENNPTKLTEVVRKYFHTQAGYEAMLLLGRRYLDEGRPSAALLCLDRLASQPFAVQSFDPELTLLRSYCRVLVGDRQEAAQLIFDLRQRMPTASLRLGAEELPRWTDITQVQAWWASRVPQSGSSAYPVDWLVHRGTPNRDTVSQGGMPILSARWRVPVANDPEDEELIAEQYRQRASSDQVLLPALSPLAVGDVVLMRTTHQVMAVDLNTGKRSWEFPWDETPDERVARAAQAVPGRGAASPRALELAERLWLDAPYGQLASDGKNVYLLHELSYAMWAGNPTVIAPGGFAFQNSKWPKPYNKLVALSVPRQGALEWVVGGPDGGDEPALANVFFLGPPLPLMGQLFALAEVTGELRLVVLDARTGRLLWQQQVAHVDTFTIDQDTQRRLAGATPSYADGILVCPTSAGAVVAIDISTRALLWGFQYPTTSLPNTPQALIQIRANRLNAGAGGLLEEAWSDATVTIADGCAILTPPETDQLFCLDLLTGVPRWPARKREGALYVACVYDGRIVLVGKHQVTAVSLADGTAAWPAPLALPNESVTGRGFHTGGYYYLPTSASRIIKIDLSTGTVAESVDTRVPLGNLICHRDQVISQGVDVLAAFHQVDALERWVKARLEKDPMDREALARKCDLLLQRGQRREAIETMWTIYRADPTEEAIKNQLVDTFLKALDDEFATYVAMRNQIEPLIDQPARKAMYLRRLSAGLQAMGRFDEAFEATLQLADLRREQDASNEAIEPLDRSWSARPRRWVQGRLAALWAATEGPQFEPLRARWQVEIQRRLEQVLQMNSRPALRQFLDQFGSLPIAVDARLAYARQLLDSGDLLAAELQLTQLLSDGWKRAEPRALLLLAELYLRAERVIEADRCLRILEELPPATPLGNTTLEKELARLRNDRAYQPVLAVRRAWPYSRVEVKVDSSAQRSIPIPAYHYTVNLEEVHGGWAEGSAVSADLRSNAIVVRDPLGRITQQALLNPTGVQFGGMYNLSRAKAVGHLLVTLVQSDLVAIDTLRSSQDGQDVVLWRTDLADTPSNVVQRRLGQRPLRHPWSQTGVRTVLADSSPQRIPLSGIGVVTTSGVCYARYRQLVCVDPLTGELLWVRDGIEPGAQLFGDDRFLFVVGFDQTEASVYSTATGEFLGKRPSERIENRWATCGTHVLAWHEQAGKLVLRIYDAWSQQEFWRREFPIGSRGELIGSDEVAVFQPDGQLVIASLRDGQERFQVQLDGLTSPAYLYVQRDEEAYYVLPGTSLPPNTRTPISSPPAGSATPIMQGKLYALDRVTGKALWPSPANLEGFAVPLNQPSAIATLVFLRGLRRAGGNQATTSLLCIDKRDGRVLYAADDLPTLQPNFLAAEITADPADASVQVVVGGNVVTLRWTDEPIPPAPPAQTGQADSGPDS